MGSGNLRRSSAADCWPPAVAMVSIRRKYLRAASALSALGGCCCPCCARKHVPTEDRLLNAVGLVPTGRMGQGKSWALADKKC
jgi:hypothetical protein